MTVDDYVASFPDRVRLKLEEMREAVRNEAPGAEETVSYGIAAYKLNGYLVFFGGFKDHVGFYPLTTAMRRFRTELSKYETSKGTVRFPLDEPLPLPLIRRIVRFRVKETRRKSAGRGS